MELRIIRCPACGASLPEVDIERSEVVRCKFCRHDVFVDFGNAELAPIQPVHFEPDKLYKVDPDTLTELFEGLLKGDYYNVEEDEPWP